MRKAALLLIFLLSFTLVSGQSNVNIYLDESGDAFFVGTTDEISLNLPAGVLSSDGEIYGITSDLTYKEAGLWKFSFELPESRIAVILPESASLENVSNSAIQIVDGRIRVVSEEKVSLEYILSGTSNNTSKLVILMGVAGLALLFAFFVYNYYKRKKKEDGERARVLYSILSDKEKKILDGLQKLGKVKMSILRKQCEIPKASFSRYLVMLEKKKLVVRSGEGKNKFVQLSKR